MDLIYRNLRSITRHSSPALYCYARLSPTALLHRAKEVADATMLGTLLQVVLLLAAGVEVDLTAMEAVALATYRASGSDRRARCTAGFVPISFFIDTTGVQ